MTHYSLQLSSPLNGTFVPIDRVPDPVFADQMLGPGFAIDCINGNLVAPFEATVEQIAQTNHSITLKTQQGAQILFHIGVDTVSLKGKGFSPHVRMGESVKMGDPLISFDVPYIKQSNLNHWVILVLLNPENHQWAYKNNLPFEAKQGEKLPISLENKKQERLDTVPDTNIAPTQVQCEITVTHQDGIHARPAAKIQQVAKKYASQVSIVFNNQSVDAKSPLSLLLLNIPQSAKITLIASGIDAPQALQDVAKAIECASTHELSPANNETLDRKQLNSLAGTGEIKNATVKNATVIQQLKTQSQNVWNALTANGGAALGCVLKLDTQWPDFEEDFSNVSNELTRLRHAFKQVRSNLQNIAPSHDIATAHLSLLDDPFWFKSIEQSIIDKTPASQALKINTLPIIKNLCTSKNVLFQERASDLHDLTAQILMQLAPHGFINRNTVANINFQHDQTVLVAEEILPSHLMSLTEQQKLHLKALVSIKGGLTSHASIIAKSLQIPFVIAAPIDVLSINDGEVVVVDGNQSLIIHKPNHTLISAYQQQIHAAEIQHHQAQASAHQAAVTTDNISIEIVANIGDVHEAALAYQRGADGIGLVRTETMFMHKNSMPTLQEQHSEYQTIVDAMCHKPVTIRTLDIGADKPLSYLNMPKEENPALGMRGIRLSLVHENLLDTQLEALLNITPRHACHIMLPMVVDVSEVLYVKERIHSLAKTLQLQTLPPLGIMIETPSAAILSDQLAPFVDFFSIGTNDLTQYTLAMDRQLNTLAPKMDSLHPAVLRMIAISAQAAQAHNKGISVCGAVAQDMQAVPILIGLGIKKLSVDIVNIANLKSFIRTLDYTNCKQLAQHVLQMHSAAQVREYVQNSIQTSLRN